MPVEIPNVTSLRPACGASALTLLLLLGACNSNGYLDVGKQKITDDPPPPMPAGTGGAWVASGSGGAGAEGGGGGGMVAPPMTTPVVPPLMPPDLTVMPPARVSDDGIPADVFAILQSRCSPCHTYGQGDLAGWGSVLDLSRMIDAEIVVPGKPGASRMIDRVVVRGDMPPKGERLSAADTDKLRAWITELKRPAPVPRSDEDILDAIAADVLKQRTGQSDYRYFSLAHFADQGRPAKELAIAKQVLAFVVNSLSRRGTIVAMAPIDPQGSIFRVRLTDLGWNAALWDELTSFYPYCLASDVAGHRALYTQLGTEAPFVRADWLLDTATRAPLYDRLIDLPATLNLLAARLGVNIANDINHPGLAEPDNLVRFAVRKSGVSLHNRMAERHLGAAGQYLWVSYDFATDIGRQDVFANPLGPRVVDRQAFVHTFEHEAGEVIFTLANGMQGYMLVNAAGNKVAVAATNVVRDVRRPNGVVENGLSCFGCHGNNGMIRPRQTDEMRRYIEGRVADFDRREFLEISVLYPPIFSPDVFTGDSTRYRSVVDTLDGGGPPRGNIEYTELVSLVGEYESSVGFRGAASEFNEDPETFRARVLANDAQNRTLPRSTADPLILRNDFVCAWRDLAPKIRPQRFCNKTFTAAAVRGLCQ